VTTLTDSGTLTFSAGANAPPAPSAHVRSLFLVSVLGLFLELLLIRWISTEIRIFAYLQNTVLVVCFLGLGVGCMTSDRRFRARSVLLPLATLSALLAVPMTRHALGSISEMLSDFGGVTIWFQVMRQNSAVRDLLGVVGLAVTFLLMVLIWDVFVPVGQLLGRLFDENPRVIQGYSANVAGSLIGIWLFVGLSAAYQPPAAWMAFFVVMVLWLAHLHDRITMPDVALSVAIVVFAWAAGRESGALEVVWSPYQKLVVRRTLGTAAATRDALDVGIYRIDVNNVGYQGIIDLRPENVAAHPELFSSDMRGLSQYDLPALLHPTHERMLFVGSGAGNDPAGGIRNGAKHVVAVEIDPAIIEIGRRYHPEHPYSQPNVSVVNDDARSYFAAAPEKSFDVIAFGLLDSHTTTAMTNARLDH
jgi:hypothetical protein